MAAPVVTEVPVASLRPLRASVLRPGRPPEESVYPGDNDPRAVHLAVVLPGAPEVREVVAVGSLLPEPPPWASASDPGDRWRIRGMATREEMRNRGYGRAVLDELLRRAAPVGGQPALAWCNARTRAVDFYLRAGFAPVGVPFDVPVIGEHQAMARRVGPEHPG